MVRAFLNSIAVAFDLPILDWIRANLQSPLMDKIMPIITLFGDGGIFWIAFAVLLICIPKTRRIGLGMGFAMIMGLLICNVTLKPLVARIRPYDLQEELGVIINLLVERQHDYSFPSGHTIASFEASVVLLKNNKLLGVPAFILAIAIAFSRLYLYVHYPTDVIVSVILGTIFALLGDALAKKIPVRKKGKYEA
ncbi:MAG: phosphatase PAP2 family protein [Oscillospiraceae bacterium]|nr:phosphatase PAP2 family protein [Oscillospiraceae bacterium]